MIIIGVDYHPSDQYIALVDTKTGEYEERQLNHSDGEAEKFYRELARRGASVRVGMEATGYSRWFERLLAELGMELWIGNAAEIKTKRVRKQKTDWEDARLLLRLLQEKNFPRIWVPCPENRDLRQLLWHRHRMVQMRTRIMNQLQALAMNEGQRRKKKLWKRSRTSPAGKAPARFLGLAAPAGSVGTVGPHEPNDRRINPSRRAGSEEVARGAAADDASGRRSTDGTGLRVDHRNSAAVSSGQADRQLCGVDS